MATNRATSRATLQSVSVPQSTFIYLASQSPRRSQLLDQLGVPHQLLLADAQEDAEALEIARPNEAPKTYVRRVTELKLKAAVDRLACRGLALAPILCADTTVALGRTIFGKPEDAQDAQRMLRALSNRPHRVITAIAVAHGGRRYVAHSESWVTFADMDDAVIAALVASGEPMGKAGAYAVQGRAAAYIAHISGSYSGIMGLPLYETAGLLRQAGLLV